LWPRYALGGVAVAQLALALAQFFGVGQAATHADHDAVPVASPLFNEGTAWNLALGVGLFWAAFRPRTASGLIPVLGGFLALLIAYSTHDVIAGTAPVTRVAGHGLLVAGLLLLILVHRQSGGASPGHALRTGSGGEVSPSTAPAEPAAEEGGDSARQRRVRRMIRPELTTAVGVRRTRGWHASTGCGSGSCCSFSPRPG
jgi:predicted anti-sigma-YlaC factor YlaD